METLKSALIELLQNPTYLQNAKKRSEIFRDQPLPPLDTAIFWIEWAMRHKNNSGAIKLPINELGVMVANSYDVIGALIISLVIAFSSILWIFKKVVFNNDANNKKYKVN